MPADPTRISDPAIRALTREIAELTRKVETLERGTRASQLGSSSIDDGTLWFTDGGVKRVSIGKQVDGKFGWGAVNGEAPPRPTPAILEASTGGVTIGWDGQFVGNAPSDFVHVKAYLSPVGASFIPSDGNVVGHLLGRAKLPVNPLPQTGYWAVLIAYNTSGVASQPSIVQGPVTPAAVVATEILDGIVTELALADGAVSRAKIATGAVGTAQLAGQSVDLSKLADGSVDATKLVNGAITRDKLAFTIEDVASIATYLQATAPTGDIPEGSLWADTSDGNRLYRWSGAAWIAMSDEGVQNALAAAQAAQLEAAEALSRAAGAEAIADGKVDIWYQDTSPSGASTGDLWINTADQNRLRRWSGTQWVIVDDQRIQAALVNAQTAQATADQKIRAFYQATAPTAGMSVGDFWYKTDAGNLPHRYNGTSWVPLPLGSGAIADGAVTTGKIAGQAIDVTKLADGSVAASKILDGAVVQGKIAANAVAADQIAANAITAGKIAANTIGANHLAANSVVAGKIAADAVTATNIVAGSVQTQHIAADAVAAGKIAADAVTAREIKALSILADKIAANAVQAGHIEAGSITADKLAALLVLASQIYAGDPDDWHLELGDSNTPILYWDNNNTGFAVSRDEVTGQANVYMSGRVEFGNGSQIEQDYLDLCEQASTGFQAPRVRQQRVWIDSGPTTGVTARWTSATQRGSLCLMAVWQTASSGSTAPNCGTPAGATIIDSRVSGASRLTLFMVPNSPTSRTAEAFGSSAGAARWAIALVEYSGIAAAALDVQAWSSGTGTVASSGTTGTTAQGNELQFAVFGSPSIGNTNGKNGQWTNPTNGFTKILEGDGFYNQGIVVATKNATGVGAVSTQITANKSVPWIGMVATFRAALAAPVPTTPPPAVSRVFTMQRGGKSTPHVVGDDGGVYPIGRVPYCTARLGGNFGVPAESDVWAAGGWLASEDPYSMIALGLNGTWSNITIPLRGRWLLGYRSVYSANADPAANASCFISLNSRTAASSVARDSRRFTRYGAGDHFPVQAQRIVILNAGDVLYWGNWSNIVTTVITNASNVPTEMSAQYLGPA